MLHNFLQYTPDISDDNIPLILNQMEEFRENAATGFRETIPKPGKYFRHQIYTARAFKYTDRMLCYQKPGTGKSCTQVASALEVLKSTDLYKNVLMVTTRPLKKSMEMQFLCKCTDGSFLEKKTKYYSGREEQGPNKKYKDTFSVITHHDLFLMAINSKKESDPVIGKTGDELRKIFNNMIIQIDEVSTLINTDFSMKDNESTYKISEDIKLLSTIKDVDDPRIINSDKKYIQIWRILHAVENTKVMCLTGTPIINYPSEFFFIANLLLPMGPEHQYDVEEISNRVFSLKDEDFTRMNGLISYVDVSENVAKMINEGFLVPHEHIITEKKNNGDIVNHNIQSQMKLFFYEMHGNQSEAVFNDDEKSVNTKKFQQINSYVGSDLLTYKDSSKDKPIEYNTLLDQMSNSSMFTHIVQTQKNSINKKTLGVTYIYSTMTESIFEPYKLMFEKYGFEVISKDDLHPTINGTTEFCGESTVEINKLKKPGDKPRVVFVDSSIDNLSVREKILRICSSKENVYGELIHTLIGSSIFEMGVNIGNVYLFIRNYGEWSISKYEQSRDRVFREDSHEHIKKILSEQTGKDINEITPEVKIRDYCPFSQFYFIHEDNYENFPIETKVNGRFTINELYYNRFLSNKIVNLIGFCKNENVNKDLNRKLISSFVNFGENIIEKLKSYIPDLIDDINLITDEKYSMVVYKFGIIYTVPCSIDIMKLLKNDVIIRNLTGIYKVLHILEYHSKEYSAIIVKDNKINEYPLEVKVVSHTYNQYMMMEKKSFYMYQVLRQVKRRAFDAKSNEKRNILDSSYDYTAKCDYNICKYKSVAEDNQLTANTSDNVIKDDEIFMDNFKISYSSDKTEKCKSIIFDKLIIKNKISISEIYNTLNEYENYFVTTALIDIIKERKSFKNKYGYDTYICFNDDTLFLRSDFSNIYIKRNLFDDSQHLNAVESDQNLNFDGDYDNLILEKIYSITFTEEDKGNAIADFSSLCKQFTNVKTNIRLLEDVLSRALFYKHLNDGENYLFNQLQGQGQDVNPFLQFYAPRQIDEIAIRDYYTNYIFKIKTPSNGIFNIHTYPSILKNQTKQVSIKKTLFSGEFRYLNRNTYGWETPTDVFLKFLSPFIKEEIENRLNPQLNIITTAGETKSMFYVTYVNSENKLMNLNQPKVYDGRNFNSIGMKELIPAIEYFHGNLNFSQYSVDIYNTVNFLYNGRNNTSNKDPFKILLIQLFKDLNLYYNIGNT